MRQLKLAPATFALIAAVSDIVIACPDTLALTTPTAITIGVRQAAREGVLFKNATALKATAGVNTVVFDKTGTLTEGKPALTDVVPAQGADAQDLLRFALLLTLQSSRAGARTGSHPGRARLPGCR